MVNKWDHYLSFSLYSDKPNNFFIAIAKDGIRELPEVYYPYFAEIEGMTNVKIIDVNKWTMEELKVPFYPETRVFKKLGKSFCNIGIEENQLMFIEYEKPLSNRIFYTFQCKDLVQD